MRFRLMIPRPNRTFRSRAVRPSLEGLETRELLSAMPSRHAEVHALHTRPHVPTIAQLPTAPQTTATTVPANGDVNPYGVVFVPPGFPQGGVLHAGDILVSNFNNSSNLQGTGTTIVRVSSNNQTSVFFQGPDRDRPDDGSRHPEARIRRGRQRSEYRRHLRDRPARLAHRP